MLGDLSKQYESNGDPGCIADNAGDAGGVSYGCYQFATNAGVPGDFVNWLNEQGHEYGNMLANAGEPGSETFSAVWAALAKADPDGFFQLQHGYTKQIYFDAAVERLKNIGFDVLSRSQALQQVLWSRAVQYSAYWMPELFDEAADMAGQTLAAISDHDLIYYIYEVNLTDPDWTSGSSDLREGLFNRFYNEREQALAMLAKEKLEA